LSAIARSATAEPGAALSGGPWPAGRMEAVKGQVFHALADGTDKGEGRSVNDNVCDDVCGKVWSGEEKWHTIPHSSTVRVAVLVNRFFRLSVNENGDANG